MMLRMTRYSSASLIRCTTFCILLVISSIACSCKLLLGPGAAKNIVQSSELAGSHLKLQLRHEPFQTIKAILITIPSSAQPRNQFVRENMHYELKGGTYIESSSGTYYEVIGYAMLNTDISIPTLVSSLPCYSCETIAKVDNWEIIVGPLTPDVSQLYQSNDGLPFLLAYEPAAGWKVDSCP